MLADGVSTVTGAIVSVGADSSETVTEAVGMFGKLGVLTPVGSLTGDAELLSAVKIASSARCSSSKLPSEVVDCGASAVVIVTVA